MKFSYYSMLAFLLAFSLGMLVLVAAADDLPWVGLIVAWVLAVVSGRLTYLWLGKLGRKRTHKPQERSVWPKASLAAAVGSSMGLLAFQSLGTTLVLLVIGQLFFAFLGGFVLMKAPVSPAPPQQDYGPVR